MLVLVIKIDLKIKKFWKKGEGRKERVAKGVD